MYNLKNSNKNYVKPFPPMSCISEFPFLDYTFDKVTDWEIMQLLGEKLNEVIKTTNNTTKIVTELKNYVNNYFNNLDVQQEINNKLDEMAQDGTLQEIIAQFINLNALWCFNSVNDMKQATNLIEGSFAKTLGYYEPNDGGGSNYIIVSGDFTEDNGNYIKLNNNLYAKLIYNNYVNVKQYGAKGDGITDDTTSIQNALNSFNNILIPNGIYMINAEISLLPLSNTKITLTKNAKLKAITNSNDYYNIINLSNVHDIIIEGGIIEGDKDTHGSQSGQWGMGISIIENSYNIIIKNTILQKCWGDGIYINSAKNIRTENIICNNNRRQGMSIISVENFHSLNDTFSNTSGNSPQAGIDIEPNLETDILKNIVIENPTTLNNAGAGIEVYININLNNPYSITINNHYDNGSKSGFISRLSENIVGNLLLNNSYYENNGYSAIVGNKVISPNSNLVINRPKIRNACTLNNSEFARNIPISFFEPNYETDASITTQNIYIIEPIVLGDYPHIININNYVNNCKNINIINPLKINTSNNSIRIKNELILKDDLQQLLYEEDTNWTIDNISIKSKLTNKKWTSVHTITINETIPLNYEFTIENINSNYRIYIQLRSGLYCKQLSDNDGIGIYLRKLGDKITLKRIDENNLIITNQIGTPSLT